MIALGALIVLYLLKNTNIMDPNEMETPTEPVNVEKTVVPSLPSPTPLSSATRSSPAQTTPLTQKSRGVAKPSEGQPSSNKRRELVLPYVLDDGLAVVQGDVVIGQLPPEDTDETGKAIVPVMQLWPSGEIPYHIQPHLPNPDRVREALSYFEGTAVHFIPYTNQADVLVFEAGTGICKSYVGKVGGHQPIWLTPDCQAREVAHEIMHALGFVHEQNRVDRDDFIQVYFDNIEDKYKDNFIKLPIDFMKINGLAGFDYESLMMYPVWMFAKPGRSTMESKLQSRQILPSSGLSRTDIERINQAYGRSN